MNCILEQSEETVTLSISEAMTIEDAANFKSALVEALAGGTQIKVNMNSVDSVDISCLQALCSAHRTALQGGKRLILCGDINDLMPCLEDAGFPRHTGCHNHGEDVCLWHEDTLA